MSISIWKFFSCVYCLFLFKTGFVYPRLASNSLCGRGWSWTPDYPALASPVLGSQACVTVPAYLLQVIVIWLLGLLSVLKIILCEIYMKLFNQCQRHPCICSHHYHSDGFYVCKQLLPMLLLPHVTYFTWYDLSEFFCVEHISNSFLWVNTTQILLHKYATFLLIFFG